MAIPTWHDGPSVEALPAPVPSERYEDRGPLGEGGMGEVRRVYDRELQRVVALKRLRLGLAERPAWRRRFEREVRVTAGLQHPGVVPVYDVGEDAAGLWYTMREVEGETLAQCWPALGADRRLEVLLRICEALAFAHSRRVVHRDLKPDNVIVGPFGEVVVLDWGLARELDAVEAHPADAGPASVVGRGLTRVGVAMGTPGFMSPEQERGAPVGPQADVWALGRLLGEAAAGRAELAAVAARCQRADPALRYPDAGALLAELRRWQGGERVEALDYPLLVDLARLGRRHRTALYGVSASALGLLVAGAVGVSQVRVERDQALSHLASAHAARATEALADGNLVDAGLYGAASLRLVARPDTRGAALAALSAGLPTLRWDVAVDPDLAASLDPGARLPGWRRDPHRACTALALSPDGATAACGTPDGVLLVEGGRARRIGQGAVGGLDLDGRGRLAVGLLTGGPTELWDLDGRRLSALPGPRNATWTVSFLPDGRLLTTGADPAVRLDGAVVSTYSVSLSNHAVSPDGKWVLLPWGQLRSLVGLPDRSLRPADATWTAAFSPDGGSVAGASWLGDVQVRLWDLQSGEEQESIARHRGVVRALAFAREDQLLSASEDGTVGIWPLSAHGIKQRAHAAGVTGLAVGGRAMVTAGRDLRVRGWRLDPAPWGAQRVRGLPSPVGVVAGTVGSVGQDTTLRRWSLRSGEALPPVQVGTWGPYLDCGSAGALVVGHEQIVVTLDPPVVHRLGPADRELLSADCDGGRLYLLERGNDPDRAWLRWRAVEVATREVVAEQDAPAGTTALIAEGGRLVFGGTNLAPVERTGGSALALPATGSGALALGPGGLLAAAGADGHIALLPSGLRRSAHQGEVRDLAISPDGRLLASAGRDGATRLWSLPGLDLLAEWRIPPTDGDSLAFEADGQTLWVGFVDGTLRPIRLAQLHSPGEALAALIGRRTGMWLDAEGTVSSQPTSTRTRATGTAPRATAP